jgi:hypothetical protein
VQYALFDAPEVCGIQLGVRVPSAYDNAIQSGKRYVTDQVSFCPNLDFGLKKRVDAGGHKDVVRLQAQRPGRAEWNNKAGSILDIHCATAR